jgi:hypothetical protein
MSKQYHWVVVYDEDWGAFMVDAESTNVLIGNERLIYDSNIGKWEDFEEESDTANEYYRLEEILAYNLTRLDLTAEIG